MPILGHGIDLVPVPRIRRMLDRHGDRFRRRCFTPRELADSTRRKREAEHLAARFAAKEAALKALGTGLTRGIAWTDIEVARLPTGAPTLTLSGQAQRAAESAGIRRWLLSLTHTSDYAAASAIALDE